MLCHLQQTCAECGLIGGLGPRNLETFAVRQNSPCTWVRSEGADVTRHLCRALGEINESLGGGEHVSIGDTICILHVC